MSTKTRTTKDVIIDPFTLGTTLVAASGFMVLFIQDWGTGSFIIAIPFAMLLAALFFRSFHVLKPNTTIPGVPFHQHPFGDEEYIASIFQAGCLVIIVLLVAVGYESMISPAGIATLFKLFAFIVTCTCNACVHVAINKMWIGARLEITVAVPGERGPVVDPSLSRLAPAPPATKTYVLWAPANLHFQKFSLMNVLVFVALLAVNGIALVTGTMMDFIPVPLPGTKLDPVTTPYMPTLLAASLVLDAVFFLLVTRLLFREINGFDLERIAPILVKLEPDDAMRERVISALERIQELKQLGI